MENEKDDENTSRLNNSLSLSSASRNIGGRFGKKKKLGRQTTQPPMKTTENWKKWKSRVVRKKLLHYVDQPWTKVIDWFQGNWFFIYGKENLSTNFMTKYIGV